MEIGSLFVANEFTITSFTKSVSYIVSNLTILSRVALSDSCSVIDVELVECSVQIEGLE